MTDQDRIALLIKERDIARMHYNGAMEQARLTMAHNAATFAHIAARIAYLEGTLADYQSLFDDPRFVELRAQAGLEDMTAPQDMGQGEQP